MRETKFVLCCNLWERFFYKHHGY